MGQYASWFVAITIFCIFLWQSHLDMITFKAFDLNLWMSQELDLCFITTSKK